MPEFSMLCPHCNSQIENIPEEKDGQIIICMECGKTVQAVSSSAAPAGHKTVDSDIVLGDKVSDSDMEGFESFEAPEEEEEIVEAELIRIRIPWRTSKFMGIVCDILFLLAACELAFCAYLIYQAQTHKTDELPRQFAEERKKMQSAKSSAQNRLTALRKNIQAQIKADEKAEAVIHTKRLLEEVEKIQKTPIPFPEKIDPAKKPILEKNPYLFFLTALKTYTLVDEDTRRSAVLELTQHLKNILDELKNQRQYDRVAVVQEVIDPFQKAGVDLSEVAIAAKAVIQFEKDEKIRLEQEAKDKVRREQERLAAIARRKEEARQRYSNFKEQLAVVTRQLYTIEDKFDFTSLRPHSAQTLFANIFLEKSRNASGALLPVEQLLAHASSATNIRQTRAEAEKLCTERLKEVDKIVQSKLSAASERAAAEKRAVELYPDIKRGENVVVVYVQGNAKYSYRGAFGRADRDGITVSGRTFTWRRLDQECRKKLDPELRKKTRADYVKKRLEQLQARQERERHQLRNKALNDLFRSGVVMSGMDVHSTASFFRTVYPVVQNLNEARKEVERLLIGLYPFFRSPVKPADKAFVSGLQAEFGLREHSNIGKAIQYYENAAKLKSVEAQLRLGDTYSSPRSSSRSVEPNLQKALYYYRLAEKQNNEYAKTRIRELTVRPVKGKNDKNTRNNNKKK